VEAPSTTENTIRILHSDAEISSCREAWERLQAHPNADYQFFKLINSFRREQIEHPCVLELIDGEITSSIWIGRLEQMRQPLQLGYLRLGGLKMKGLVIITGGILGDDSEDVCKVMLKSALRFVNDNRLDVLVLNYLSCEHPLFKLAKKTSPCWYCRDWGVTPSIHWRMTLPASFDEFLQQRSKKHRYWLKRLSRVLEEAFPSQVNIRSFKEASEVEDFCRDADAVSKATYQHHLGEAFRADAEYKARCKLLAAQGQLRGYILYVKNEPKAYWMATVYHNTLHLNLTGYVPEMKKFELGTVLLMRLFADHCGTAVRKVDFGHGGAPYKERFGDESYFEASVRIYRVSLRALLVNSLIGVNEKIATGIKTVLLKLGVLQRIKKFWRGRLSN
jgi:hypothetical protein